ncbi:MAG: hypothetical protein IJL05_05260 [Alphaproteobacteria bacterium]|nr:hypothetical protein [Alphaproteobacteria bacterium]
MLRIFSLIFIGLFLCLSAHAENVCVKDGTYIGILRKNINVTGDDKITYNSDTKEWKDEFDYKTITGIASCNGTSGSFGTANSGLTATTSSTGRYCWCKIEPVQNYGYYTGVSSYWVFLKDFGDNTSCAADATGCTAECAKSIAYNSHYNNFRTKLFSTIQIGSTMTQGSCPSGYANLASVSSSSFATYSNGCSDGYYVYDTAYSCSTGYKWVNGTCAELCRLDSETTKTLSGQTVSLFANPVTEKYLTVAYSTGKCYINLTSGSAATSGVNIITNSNTYHTTD